jgi:hypothetical protein
MQALEGDYLEKDTAEIYSMIPPNFRPERKIQVCEIDLPTLLEHYYLEMALAAPWRSPLLVRWTL